jgi:hypothetical protein
MKAYDLAVAFGWIAIIIGFLGALMSSIIQEINYVTCYAFLVIILCGVVAWFFAFKGGKFQSVQKWSDPKILCKIINIVVIGNLGLWMIIRGYYTLLEIIEDNLWGMEVLLNEVVLWLLISLPHIIIGTICIILSTKIEKNN